MTTFRAMMICFALGIVSGPFFDFLGGALAELRCPASEKPVRLP